MKRPALVANIRPRAREDVDAIAATIASEHPKAALRFLDVFDAAIDRLVQFPELGQVWPTNRPNTFATVRRLVLRGFRVSIFYRPTDTTLEVLRVLRHGQHAPPLLDDL